jgi:hypothetical protein
MKCPKCKKKIDAVCVESVCTQEATLDKNKIVDWSSVKEIGKTLGIYCQGCGANITDRIKE